STMGLVFSSRRRHTRSKRDWSSDVCSSDLTVQMTVAESSMLKELTIDGASETTVQEDEVKNTRVAQFVVGNIDKPLDGKMHVVVPEIEGYDNEYMVQFVFNTSKIPGGSEEQ